jgi:hypothetical protein
MIGTVSLESIRAEYLDLPGASELVSEFQQTMIEFDKKCRLHEVNEELDKSMRVLKYEFGQSESNFPRFMDRVEASCVRAEQELEKVYTHTHTHTLSLSHCNIC